MSKEYNVNNIFNESGVALNELISTFLLAFLDKNFNSEESNNITSNL